MSSGVIYSTQPPDYRIAGPAMTT